MMAAVFIMMCYNPLKETLLVLIIMCYNPMIYCLIHFLQIR